MKKKLQLQKEIKALIRKKIEAVKAQQFDLAATIRDKEQQLKWELEKLDGKGKHPAQEMDSEDLNSDPYLLNKIVVENLCNSLKKSTEEEMD